LKGKAFDVDDGFLKRIRVAQFGPGVTRVVLEVGDDVGEYSAFLLPNPYRLVIDVHGKTPAKLMARNQQPQTAPETPVPTQTVPGVKEKPKVESTEAIAKKAESAPSKKPTDKKKTQSAKAAETKETGKPENKAEVAKAESGKAEPARLEPDESSKQEVTVANS